MQIALERWLSAYPGKLGMERDIYDVTLWLKEKSQEHSLFLGIGRHYFYPGPEIANVKVMTLPKHPESLTAMARDAFLALGYVIENTGADTYGYPLCDGHNPRHGAIQAFERIETALRRWHHRNLTTIFHQRAAQAALFLCLSFLDLATGPILRIDFNQITPNLGGSTLSAKERTTGSDRSCTARICLNRGEF